jgi:hypothetical protein
VAEPILVNLRWVFICWICFLSSLFFPVFFLVGPDRVTDSEIYGIALLLLGWAGFADISNVGWFANPLLCAWTVLICRRRIRMAAFVSAISLALVFTVWGKSTMVIDGSGQRWTIISYGAGFYLWHITFVLSVLVSAFGLWVLRSQATGPVHSMHYAQKHDAN